MPIGSWRVSVELAQAARDQTSQANLASLMIS